jgi:small subunit ribosomal protein S1
MVTRETTGNSENELRNDPQVDSKEQASIEQEDFATLFEASESYSSGRRIQLDSKIDGTVISIGEEWVFVDIGGKTEGSIAKEELVDQNGELNVGVGDQVSAYVVNNRDGDIRLSVKMTAAASEEAIRGAFTSGVPVEGLVTTERKGGYSVSVFGKDAFCPYSQIDIRSGGDSTNYINKRLTFRIVEYSEGGRNIVLSRKDILQEERQEQVSRLKERLKPGDIVDGTVQNIRPFGAFVDIGGVDGLIPMSQLAWHRVDDPTEILQVGDQVTVKVMEIDWDNDRLSLSRKEALPDPWLSASDRFPEGTIILGKVTKLMNFGAFVQLEPGVEGLVHISELGEGRRINHPKEVVTEGEELEVRVASFDQEAKRISLELTRADVGRGEGEMRELKVGEVVSGIVDAVKEYGVFVNLSARKTGLLHVSEISGVKSTDLKKRFPIGETIDVEILSIDHDTDRISLSMRSLDKRDEESHYRDFKKGGSVSTSFGTLGDLLKGKLKE